MSLFSESFHKELGTRTARYLVRGIAVALTSLATFLCLHKQIAIVVSIAIAAILLLWLAIRLFFRYFQIVRRKRTVEDILGPKTKKADHDT